ncbi:hypothetical protein GGI15_000657 [Coemansia interrupta]|uniref:Uncharacterized protein n=1 Tax=Coemansia interrupta TaxID=1126814 RepID=A0A9W8HQQ3_9FUNG|nr:hypothetical protein GGI15_000657 [Coemansia interrupta]
MSDLVSISLGIEYNNGDVMESLTYYVHQNTDDIPMCVYFKASIGRWVVECQSFEQAKRLLFAPSYVWKSTPYGWESMAGASLKGLIVQPSEPGAEQLAGSELSKAGNMWLPLTRLADDRGSSNGRFVCILEVPKKTVLPTNIVSAEGNVLAELFDTFSSKACCLCSKIVGYDCQCTKPIAASNVLDL